MTHPDYPIIEQRWLKAPQRGLLGRRRTRDEIPVAAANQRLVYKIDGELVEDDTSMSLKNDRILRADFVTLVDVSAHVRVPVQLTIRSEEDSKLRVEVTFTCTVTKAVEVARTGVNAAKVLTVYLESHHKFYELAIGHTVAQINEIRRMVNAQVTSFTTIQPPQIPGMHVSMASIQVHTPEEWEKFSQEREQYSIRQQQDQLAHSQQVRQDDLAWRLETEELVREEFRKAEEQRIKHDLEYTAQRQEDLMAAEKQRSEQKLQRAEQERLREEVRRDAEAYGEDPTLMLFRAYQAGTISDRELATQLGDQRDRALAREQEIYQLDRADRDREREWARTDDTQDRAWSREDRVRELEEQREQRQWQRTDHDRALEAAQRADLDRVTWEREQLRLDRAEQSQDREWSREQYRLDRGDQTQDREWAREDRNRTLDGQHEERLRELEYQRLRLDREIEREEAAAARAHELGMERLRAEQARLIAESERVSLEGRERITIEREDQLRQHELLLEGIRSDQARLALETQNEREDQLRAHELEMEWLGKEEAKASAEAERLREEARLEQAAASRQALWEREDKIREHERELERARIEERTRLNEAEGAREAELRKLLWEREDLKRQAEFGRADKLRQAELNEKIVIALLESGHANTTPIDVERLITGATQGPADAAPMVGQADTPVELPSGEDKQGDDEY